VAYRLVSALMNHPTSCFVPCFLQPCTARPHVFDLILSLRLLYTSVEIGWQVTRAENSQSSHTKHENEYRLRKGGISRCDFLINDKGLNILHICPSITQGKGVKKRNSLLCTPFSGLSNGKADSCPSIPDAGP
jgi:hypothetical protein